MHPSTVTRFQGFWEWYHLVLQDAVRQYGWPSAFITKSPSEWSFPQVCYTVFLFTFSNICFNIPNSHVRFINITWQNNNFLTASITSSKFIYYTLVIIIIFQLYLSSNISCNTLCEINYNLYFSNRKSIIFLLITKTMFLVWHIYCITLCN